MLVVETIARIRRDHLVKGVPIKKIARDLRVSKNTVRKVVRGDETSFSYARKIQPMPKLGPWVKCTRQRWVVALRIRVTAAFSPLLAWDGTGLVLTYKRLEEGRFAWPRIGGGGARDGGGLGRTAGGRERGDRGAASPARASQ